MERVLTCILNNQAGSNSAEVALPLIKRAAAERGWEARVSNLAGADLKSITAEARAVGGLVVGGGGDGTISAVAAALVGSDAALGVLPMGTLNHFAKDLGIPLELEKAVETLFTGKVARVDVGEVNGHVFLNNSSIGFYPQIVQERTRQQRQGRGKWVAFARASARVVQRSHSLHVSLQQPSHSRQSYDTPFVFVGNNRYSVAGLEIGTRERLDGGKLWVCAAPHANRLKLFALALEALLGFAPGEDLATFETEQTEVRMRRDHVHVATDGEVSVMQTPLRYRSRPGALCVVVPSAN